MTTPTRQEIKAAHESLDFLCVSLFNNPDTRLEKLAAAQTAIEKVLPPKPLPTMAEVEWDDDKHFLAEAENVEWGTVIMLRYERGFDRIQILDTGMPNKFGFVLPASLIPTGRRYTLTEAHDD